MKKIISLNEIVRKINAVRFKKYDLIVAIGTDGIMPARLIQKKLKIPIEIIKIKYRNKANKPIYRSPKLISQKAKFKGKKILLVDLVSRTGKTLEKAKRVLKGNAIQTFVINGQADNSLYNLPYCIKVGSAVGSCRN
ncbi:MAG: phosphoribosyltransferase family protein [bacterium]